MPTYQPPTKIDLRERIKELEQRIQQMDRRDKMLGDLKGWLFRRKLTPIDLLWMYRQMAPKRAKKAVVSKNPLHAKPPMRRNGKVVEPKGDPEFRRRIKDARKKLGLSSVVVGKKIGISHATLTAWEAGRFVPAEENRVKLVKFLSLPADLGAEASKAMQAAYPRTGNGKAGV